jgi:hypothetical protein
LYSAGCNYCDGVIDHEKKAYASLCLNPYQVFSCYWNFGKAS